MKQSTLLWLLGLGVLAVALKNRSVSGMQDPDTIDPDNLIDPDDNELPF